MSQIYSFDVIDIQGQTRSLAEFKDKTLLIVNVASKCGFTKQYSGLEALYQKYKDKNFVILGFPCNQFGGQEPGEEKAIQEFCSLNFGVTFPLFSKVKVNGREASELFKFLKKEAPGLMGTEAIKWNFTKFLVNKEGAVVKRFGSNETPENLAPEIEAIL